MDTKLARTVISAITALSGLVNSYNVAVAELGQNRGQSSGALNGDSIVLSLQQGLSQIFRYTATSGSISNLTQLGITSNKDGTLSFDPSVVSGLSATQIAGALSFLGNSSSGFLQVATDSLNVFTDSDKGIIAAQSHSLQAQNQRDQDRIDALQKRLDLLQESLVDKMAKADALIAALEQKNKFLQGLFQYATSNNPNAGTAG